MLAAIVTLLIAIGGLIYSVYSWNQEQRNKRKDKEIKVATDTFERISEKIDKHFHAMTVCVYAMDEKDEEEKKQTYGDIVYEWHVTINRDTALLQMYFGEETKKTYVNDIIKKSTDLHEKLMGYYKEQDKIATEKFKKEFLAEVPPLKSTIEDFNITLINALKDGKVGSFR